MNKRYQRFYKTNTNRRRAGSGTGRAIRVNERKRRLLATGVVIISAFFVLFAVIYSFRYYYRQMHKEPEVATTEEVIQVPPLAGVAEQFPDLPITEEFLDVNQYSRPGSHCQRIRSMWSFIIRQIRVQLPNRIVTILRI